MVSKVQVYQERTPKLRNPVMVCGLPDSGNVAKLVMDELVRQLKAEKFAEIYSNSLPPRVLMRKDGTVDLMKHVLYSWVNVNGGGDVLLYTATPSPPTRKPPMSWLTKRLRLGNLSAQIQSSQWVPISRGSSLGNLECSVQGPTRSYSKNLRA